MRPVVRKNYRLSKIEINGPIGQKELVKAAIIVEIQMIVAVLSCLQQDIPWTKRVGKIAFKY